MYTYCDHSNFCQSGYIHAALFLFILHVNSSQKILLIRLCQPVAMLSTCQQNSEPISAAFSKICQFCLRVFKCIQIQMILEQFTTESVLLVVGS